MFENLGIYGYLVIRECVSLQGETIPQGFSVRRIASFRLLVNMSVEILEIEF